MSLISSIGSFVKKNPLVFTALSLLPMVSSLLGGDKDKKTEAAAVPGDGFDQPSPVTQAYQASTAADFAAAEERGRRIIEQSEAEMGALHAQVKSGMNLPIRG